MQIKHTLLCGLLALTNPLGNAGESSLIRGPLQNTGVDTDASGSVRSEFTCRETELDARLCGLTPGASYQFLVAGIEQADFEADSQGRACLHFRLEPDADEFALDFDPRGQEIAITDGTSNVLTMVYSGEGEPEELVVDERTTLARADGVSCGRVEARYLDHKSKSRFILHLLGLERGTYTVRVAGADKAEVDLSKGRSALVVFEDKSSHSFWKRKSKGRHGNDDHDDDRRGGDDDGDGNDGHHGKGKGHKNKLALDFDPRGELIEIAKDGVVVFSGVMLAQIEELQTETEGVTIPLDSTGVDADATGSAVISTDSAGQTKFTVTVAQLPAGSYELVIAETPRGSIVVTDDGTGATLGELVFSTAPTGTELPLNFEIAGSLQIRQGELVFFSAFLE